MTCKLGEDRRPRRGRLVLDAPVVDDGRGGVFKTMILGSERSPV